MNFNSIPEIINDIKQGKIVIILDDERENEGDMIVAAEFATVENIAFMMKYGCGIICTPISTAIAEKFQLDLLPRRSCDDLNQCFNTVSFDGKDLGGISAIDRSKSIMMLVSDETTIDDIKTPGHVFPLVANEKGVLGRPGHTEAAIDLVKLANLKAAAALVEVMNDKKDCLAANSELIEFAQQHNLKISTVRALIEYRKGQI
jgi:3,4-dihydroxy 2-butanone 4-phosphate synthase/GTP cyclohydrolase II